MRNFDTKVQNLRYRVLREVAHQTFADILSEHAIDIPKMIVPGRIPTMRCCVYKERAILAERVKFAMDVDRESGNVIEVIDIACDECPAAGYEVTDLCRGCLAHHCENACKRGAISFDHRRVAYIDKTKCAECGACARACPYFAIIERKRPCYSACKSKAISVDENNAAMIDRNRCTSCGACVYQCPFGAMTDRSEITSVIRMLKNSDDNRNYKVYAILAPSFAGQFEGVKAGQIVTGLSVLGFAEVCEAAAGADRVALREAEELCERGFLINSCCPAFADYIVKNVPDLAKWISAVPSPMAETARAVKEKDPDAKCVFIGPCTAKKAEAKKEDVRPYVDAVLTFEELQALFDSRGLDIAAMEETKLEGASYYGRSFAVSGGVAKAVTEVLRKQGSDFKVVPRICDGIDECIAALKEKQKGTADFNFLEGMACVGGCVGGAGCLIRGIKGKKAVEQYASDAAEMIEKQGDRYDS